jgi:sugar-specific transcriptional regulator TrmB
VAVEPQTALDRLLDDKKRELEEKANQYEEIVDNLVDELETAEPVEETFWTAAVGPVEAVDLQVERLAAADERIIIVATTLSQQFDVDLVGDLIVEELSDALDRGVKVSLLMRPELVEMLPESVGERYRTSLARHEQFSVRTHPNVSGTFELIDNAEVCIEVPHPLNAEETFAMIDLKDREFAANIRSEFDPRWEDADPLNL